MIRNIYRSFKRILNIFFDSLSLKAIKTLPSWGAVTLIDIGAAGEIEPRWKNFSKNITYGGFVPDASS